MKILILKMENMKRRRFYKKDRDVSHVNTPGMWTLLVKYDLDFGEYTYYWLKTDESPSDLMEKLRGYDKLLMHGHYVVDGSSTFYPNDTKNDYQFDWNKFYDFEDLVTKHADEISNEFHPKNDPIDNMYHVLLC